VLTLSRISEEEEDFEWYLDFVKKDYKPRNDEIIAVFRITPSEEISIEDAVGRVASESSVGTWTTLYSLPPRIRELMAKGYEIISLNDGSYLVKVAYPLDLFEERNIPQLMSSIAGNIFGMKAIKGLRLEDIYFPEAYIKYFNGPIKGISGVRDSLKIYGRPLLATVPKPKVGMDINEYANAAYEILSGGIDLLKDDENLSSQKFIRFSDRLHAMMKVIEKIEKESGERKGYLVNVTAETNEMSKRIKLVADYGNEFIMIDFVIIGWSAVQTVRELAEEYNLAIHAHRAFHAAFTRNPFHGLSMFVLAKLARLIGVDHIHVGTPGVGKLEAKTTDVVNLCNLLREHTYKPINNDIFHLEQPWYKLKSVFPTSSGGLHPGTLPIVLENLGKDLIIQVGGGVMGHPDGPRSGGKAVRDAIEATIKGIPLEEYAKDHIELQRALNKWGFVRPI
jgi:ribulose-bisphosphate carboxylase large chain